NLSAVTVDLPGVTNILLDDSTLGFGSYSGYPQIFRENIYTYADMISINHGKHNLRAGVEVRRNIENSNWSLGRPSYAFFDSLFFAIDAPYGEGAGVDPGFIGNTPARLEANVRHWRNWEISIYGQDDWKLSPRLTLNLGLRYDLFTRLAELNHLATTFLKGPGNNFIDNITTGAGQIKDASTPCPGNPRAPLAGVCGPGGFAPASTLGAGDHNNFGPRIGFAWDVFGNGKTSVRGGFGVSYEGTLYNPLSNSRWNLPYYNFGDAVSTVDFAGNGGGNATVVYGPQSFGCLPVSFTGAPCALNNEDAPGTAGGTGNVQGWSGGQLAGFPQNSNLAILTGIILPEGIRDPYVYNFYLSFQREIFAKTVLEIDYVGTAGHKLFRAEGLHRIPGGRLPCGVTATDPVDGGVTVTGRRGCPGNPLGTLNGNYLRLRNWQNSVNSNYSAMQVALRKQTSHGLTFNVNYTWSHSLDIGSTWHSGATTANGRAPGEGFSSDQVNPKLDYGNSIFDVRHRVVLNYIWEMPWFKNEKGFKGFLLGGWQWN